jgi:monoamine oxidase
MTRLLTSLAAFALLGLVAGPAAADCAMEIVKTKTMSDQASDPSKREMALQHLMMAQGKITEVQHSAMQGEEMMPEAGGMAKEDKMMSAGESMAKEGDKMMSGDARMAKEGGDMAMMEQECMDEVMQAQEALH